MDFRYPGMEPVYCIELFPEDVTCHITIGKNLSLIGYPTINSIGNLFASKSMHKKCKWYLIYLVSCILLINDTL